LTIDAIANATAATHASADAFNKSAIDVRAHAYGQHVTGVGPTATMVGGNANASLTNNAAIAINAIANANGSSALAHSLERSAIFVSAAAYGTGATPVGGNAVASLVNDGTIQLGAHADAYGTTGSAHAYATNNTALGVE